VRANHYYFYIQDADFGPAFIKICLNGHEWAKQQLRKEGIAFAVLATASCPALTRSACRQAVSS
jgi:hypothetical protein